jgi:hypothetical protein
MIEPGTLEAMVRERGGGAYVVTASPEGRPHVTYAPVRWEDGRFAAEVGARTAENARMNPVATLLLPGRSADDYSLIVDGAVSVEPDRRQLFLVPTRAVLHRPGSPADPTSSCTADCVPLLAAPARLGPRPAAPRSAGG